MATTQDLVNNLMSIGSLTEKDAKGNPVPHSAGYYLAHIHFDALAIHQQNIDLASKVDALTALVQQLVGKTA